MTKPVSPPPAPNAADRAAEVLIAAAGEVPLAGPIVTALLQKFGTAYSQRLDAWRQQLYEAFDELSQRDLLADAVQRPEWVTAVHDATRIALGEHLEEKLVMLKAILINAALENEDGRLADVLTLRYLRWVDELDPEHVAVLRHLRHPDDVEAKKAVGRIPAEILALVASDLDSRKLIVGTVTRTERTRVEPKANPGPLDPAVAHDRIRGHLEFGPVKSDLTNAMIVHAGRRFLDWLTIV